MIITESVGMLFRSSVKLSRSATKLCMFIDDSFLLIGRALGLADQDFDRNDDRNALTTHAYPLVDQGLAARLSRLRSLGRCFDAEPSRHHELGSAGIG
jgi:hypothetical protein